MLCVSVHGDLHLRICVYVVYYDYFGNGSQDDDVMVDTSKYKGEIDLSAFVKTVGKMSIYIPYSRIFTHYIFANFPVKLLFMCI